MKAKFTVDLTDAPINGTPNEHFNAFATLSARALDASLTSGGLKPVSTHPKLLHFTGFAADGTPTASDGSPVNARPLPTSF